MIALLSKPSLEIQPGINIFRMCRDNIFRIHNSSVPTLKSLTLQNVLGSILPENWAQVWLCTLPKEHSCFYCPSSCHYLPIMQEIEALVISTLFFSLWEEQENMVFRGPFFSLSSSVILIFTIRAGPGIFLLFLDPLKGLVSNWCAYWLSVMFVMSMGRKAYKAGVK